MKLLKKHHFFGLLVVVAATTWGAPAHADDTTSSNNAPWVLPALIPADDAKAAAINSPFHSPTPLRNEPKPNLPATDASANPAESAIASSPTPYLSPEEEAKKFVLKDGYHLELVVSDPIIKEPVVAAFDGNGRMYVAEMRSYMQDIDGKGEHVRNSRISLHWSSKGNGIYDKDTVFADNLLLPRMILPLSDGILVNETDSDDIWLYRDTKGAGVSDKKELFHAGGGRGGNLEHQPSGLIWDLDNWLYMSVNAYRLRIQGTNVLNEPTPANFGQWGLCQDEYGKIFNINAGSESGPVHYQTPIIYDHNYNYNEDVQFVVRNYQEVYPLVGLADVQGGTPRFRPADKTLNHFTATCGDEIYRGDRLPADLHGDLVFCEPVGRLICRSKIEVKEGFTRLANAYDKSEFIRSTDPNFRPVNLTTAPDGTLYIVDMYRGIIQESDWVRPGSYLRPMVEKYQLEKNFGRGRIWRLVYKDLKPGPQPQMLDEKPAQLVKHLAHPNGWWRNTAQKLLVLGGDKSVVPALIKMARSNKEPLARIHALWTLEGLDSLNPELLHEKFSDPNPQVRIAAIRTSESLYKKGDQSLVPEIAALAKDPDVNVVIQALLTADLLKWPGSKELLETTVAANPAYGVQKLIGPIVNAPPVFDPAPMQELTAEEKKRLVQGESIYNQLCFACHGQDGKGAPLQGGKPGETMAPPLSDSKTATGFRDGIIDVVLKGLNGPIRGKNYTAQMVPMESNDDEWVAAVTSFIRTHLGNRSTLIKPADVARARAAVKNRKEPWTLEELQASLPQPLANRGQWKVTASHNPSSARLAIDGDIQSRFDTGTQQVPGMWFQIELPQATEIDGLELDAGTSTQDYPRGYKVELSGDGQRWGKPVAIGQGTGPQTEIVFPTAKAKFIRITQTGSVPGLFWSIHELQVLKPGQPVKPGSATAKKSSGSVFE